jgi:hypothetical protein
MYKLPTIIIQFDKEIESKAIPFFRGAVIASLEKKDILFHNHIENKLRYSYPLIQYKRIHKKAAVMGIGNGIEVISQLLTANNFCYQIGNENVEMKIESVNAKDHEISLTENADNLYRLHNWLPLNSSNYAKYQNTESMVERIQILERILIGNILSFLKGVNIHKEEHLELHITDIKGQCPLTYKNVKLIAFDIEFKTNIFLPQYIGIGKNASVGCGVLTVVNTSVS